MSYAYTDGQGREIFGSSSGSLGLLGLFPGGSRFSKEDQALINQGILAEDTSRWSGDAPPPLSLDDKRAGYRWQQVGSRTVTTPGLRITHGAGKGGFSPDRSKAVPIWQKVGGSTAAAADPPAQPFTPSSNLVAAKERVQAYQSGSGGGGGRTPNFDLTGGDLFNELWAQGERQTDDYERRFVPQLQANALLNSAEVGEATTYHLNRFLGKPPKVADARAAYDYYAGKITNANA